MNNEQKLEAARQQTAEILAEVEDFYANDAKHGLGEGNLRQYMESIRQRLVTMKESIR